MQQETTTFMNIVRVGNKEADAYLRAVLLAMAPENYEITECIRVQVAAANLQNAEYLIRLFMNAGLYEESRVKKEIWVNPKSGASYCLPNAYEIVLKKIPALRH